MSWVPGFPLVQLITSHSWSWYYFNIRYEKYSVKKGWKYEVLEIAESDLKGYKVCLPCFIHHLKCYLEYFYHCWFKIAINIVGSKGACKLQIMVLMPPSKWKCTMFCILLSPIACFWLLQNLSSGSYCFYLWRWCVRETKIWEWNSQSSGSFTLNLVLDCSLCSQIRDFFFLCSGCPWQRKLDVFTPVLSLLQFSRRQIWWVLLVLCIWTVYKHKCNFRNSSREQCAQGSKILHLGTLDAYRASDQGSSAVLSLKGNDSLRYY